MGNLKLPEGYQTIMPYLIIKDAVGFFKFVQAVFGGVEKHLSRNDDNSIMHGEVFIDGSTIMFAEASHNYTTQNAGLYINVANCDETYLKALANGAKKILEPANKEYGRSAGVTDPFGNTWWITSAI